MITSPHKKHYNNSTRRVQKWSNFKFEINSIYRHWKMSNGKWMPVFVFFQDHFYFLDFNYSLKDFLVPESKPNMSPFMSQLTLSIDLHLWGSCFLRRKKTSVFEHWGFSNLFPFMLRLLAFLSNVLTLMLSHSSFVSFISYCSSLAF